MHGASHRHSVKSLALGKIQCQQGEPDEAEAPMTRPQHRRVAREPAGSHQLEGRRAAVLQAVVAEYIGTATPVGSEHVARAPGVEVSSATVRSDMAWLEEEGYLIQPHTSAGRIPTDRGYRFFVDHLTEPGVLGPAQRYQVRRFFEQVHGEIEDVMRRTSGLLSELTSYAAVVVGPTNDQATVRSAQVVGLAPRLALLVIVLSDGAVEKRTLEVPEDLDDDVLAVVSAELQRLWRGRPVAELDIAGARTGDPKADALMQLASMAAREIRTSTTPDQVFVGGPSRLAEAFDAVQTVRTVLGILEQQLVVVNLIREVLDRGLSVAIGREHGYEPLASCAVVVAPVTVDGYESGAVGLLGPTRMNYPQALAAAHVVGEGLGRRIGSVFGRAGDDAHRRTRRPDVGPRSRSGTNGMRGRRHGR